MSPCRPIASWVVATPSFCQASDGIPIGPRRVGDDEGSCEFLDDLGNIR